MLSDEQQATKWIQIPSGDLDRLHAQRDRYRESLIHTAASLAAAISLLERGSKKAAPSDKMFDMMLDDYRKALASARTTLKREQTSSST
jgi:hypothetical protein